MKRFISLLPETFCVCLFFFRGRWDFFGFRLCLVIAVLLGLMHREWARKRLALVVHGETRRIWPVGIGRQDMISQLSVL